MWSDPGSATLAVLGAVCATLVTVALLRRSQVLRPNVRAATRVERQAARECQQTEDELRSLLTEIEETAARIEARIESRLRELAVAVPPPGPSGDSAPAAPTANVAARVRALAEGGMPSSAIAASVGKSPAEVELILSLKAFESQLPG